MFYRFSMFSHWGGSGFGGTWGINVACSTVGVFLCVYVFSGALVG